MFVFAIVCSKSLANKQKIVTNKAEALRKFLIRKGVKDLTPAQKKVVQLAKRKNKEDTVLVKSFDDGHVKDLRSITNATNNKKKKNNNMTKKKKKQKRGRGGEKRNERDKKRKKITNGSSKKASNDKNNKKKKRSDSFSLLNGALTSRR